MQVCMAIPRTSLSSSPVKDARPSKATRLAAHAYVSDAKANLPGTRHTCPECGKSFTRSTGLQNHLQRHTGERPFPCSYDCGRDFKAKDDCVGHERAVHEDERKHVCHGCGHAFAKPFVRKRHLGPGLCCPRPGPLVGHKHGTGVDALEKSGQQYSSVPVPPMLQSTPPALVECINGPNPRGYSTLLD